MKTKRCSKCHIEKPFDGFYTRKARGKKDVPRRVAACKECHKIDQAARSPAKEKLVTEKVCSKCGVLKPIDQYFKASLRANRRSSACKTCTRLKDIEKCSEKKPHVVEKTCPKCVQLKPAKEFSKCSRNVDGYQTRCKSCDNDGNVEAARKSRYKLKYCMTIEQYDQLFADQGGKCKICGAIPDSGKSLKYLHVDHDHTTGEVRGLLCNGCNRGLGFFNDNPKKLIAAAGYLNRS